MNQDKKNGIGYIFAGGVFLVLDLWIFSSFMGGADSVSVPRILYVFYSVLGFEITSLLFAIVAIALIAFGIFKVVKAKNPEVDTAVAE
ncbi:hypothetical protein [Culicoidibacter larvae]|uniref:Uncharacterized protein n=1 Tax=Culicoidibacter larvae TaxID=2579976 RepID=A0A5R8QCB8_9FIRM|nr:hypothetical protein [Culicoidibacter larvae]TLG73930.1 hypothetical protein FEZ08_07305 [Culicoidibacter larvae]